jgi:Cu/Ag efflux protein CusF
MNLNIAAGSFLVVLAMAPLSQAADEQIQGAEGHIELPADAKMFSAHGKVNSVDTAAGKVNISHDAIRELKWPKMTMDFQAHDPAMLRSIKPGMEVNFDLMKMDGIYHLVKITPVQ